MKRLLLLSLLFSQFAWSQNILLVDDNDYITQNSDSIQNALDASIYSGYTYWNIADAGDVAPTADEMLAYDLVIWYCSTDGSGLYLWNNEGNPGGYGDLIDYIIEEKPLWIIGSDFMFEIYGAGPSTLSSGDFAYDQMGIESYDVQSYGDDGSEGVPQVDLIPGGPTTTFKDSILWAFATHWWVDGVTPRTGAINFYEMGPDSYVLANEITMFHYPEDLNNVMTTLFDPALIDNEANTTAFLEAVITYLLPEDLGLENEYETPSIYPNPTSENFVIRDAELESEVRIFSSLGTLIRTITINSYQEVLDVSDLEKGVYIVNYTTSKRSQVNANLILN